MSVFLAGDSVLDNFYWLNDKEKDLRYRLRELGLKCENYAVDESQLNDVINGITPRKQYAEARPYPYLPFVEPLKIIEKERPDYVVLSVGGNDLRVSLPSIIFGVRIFLENVLTPKYRTNYLQTIKRIQKTSKLILVSVYTPYYNEGIYSMLKPYREEIMGEYFDFLNDIAKECNIPILDLDRTMNPENRSHYGSTPIEPSDTSNIIIAKMIKNIINNYCGYKIYYDEEFFNN